MYTELYINCLQTLSMCIIIAKLLLSTVLYKVGLQIFVVRSLSGDNFAAKIFI